MKAIELIFIVLIFFAVAFFAFAEDMKVSISAESLDLPIIFLFICVAYNMCFTFFIVSTMFNIL